MIKKFIENLNQVLLLFKKENICMLSSLFKMIKRVSTCNYSKQFQFLLVTNNKNNWFTSNIYSIFESYLSNRHNFPTDFHIRRIGVVTIVVRLVLVIQLIGYMNMILWHCIKHCKVPLMMVKVPVWTRILVSCQTYLF